MGLPRDEGPEGPLSVAALGTLPHAESLRERLRRRLPAGIVDSGLSSLAAFCVGLAAIRYLPAAPLGVYALFNTAFVLAQSVAATLVFAPAEADNVHVAADARTDLLRYTLPLGAKVSLVSACVVMPAALLVPSTVHADIRLPLMVTAAALAFVSPLQDHARRVLHQAGLNWRAAGTSLVQLLGVLAALGVLLAAHAPAPWLPFSALAGANVLSLSAAWRFAGPLRKGSAVHLRRLAVAGRWLLSGSLYSYFSGFLSITLLTVLARPEDAGYAEAARVLSQPVNVVALGALAVLSPDLMAAARRSELRRVRLLLTVYGGVVVATGLVWAVLVGVPWSFSPLPHAFDAAFHEPFLLVIFTGYVTSYAVSRGLAAALLGAGQARTQAVCDIVIASCVVATVTFLAGVVEAYGLAAAGMVGSVIGSVGMWYSGRWRRTSSATSAAPRVST